MKNKLQNILDEFLNKNKSLEIKIKQMKCDDYLNNVAKIDINDIAKREEHMKQMKINKYSIVRVMV